MRRKQDWQFLLADYFNQCKDKSFIWGDSDCIMFSINAVLAITGNDIAGKNRGSYTDKKTAIQVLRQHYENDADNVFNYTLGDGFENVKLAQRGDIVRFTDLRLGKTYGVVALDGINAVFQNDKSLVLKPLLTCEKHWKVG